jgi:hypothetical protein
MKSHFALIRLMWFASGVITGRYFWAESGLTAVSLLGVCTICLMIEFILNEPIQ